MKSFLMAVVFSFLLNTTHAGVEYYTGAYWTLKAPTPVERHAGNLEAHLLDNAVEIDIYFDRKYSETVVGSFTNGIVRFSARTETTEPGAAYYVFQGTLKDKLIVGTWKYWNGSAFSKKGKWQATYSTP